MKQRPHLVLRTGTYSVSSVKRRPISTSDAPARVSAEATSPVDFSDVSDDFEAEEMDVEEADCAC